MKWTILIDLLVKLLANGTKLGVATATVNAFNMSQAGNLQPTELMTYVGGPVAAGMGIEIFSPLLERLKGFAKPATQQRLAFIQSAVAMMDEFQSEGLPDEMELAAVWGEKRAVAKWVNVGIRRDATQAAEIGGKVVKP